MTSQKLFFIIIFLLIVLIAGFFFWSKKNQKFISPISQTSQTSPISPTPTPSPSPLLNITDQSNLTDEINKLKVPEFSDDYQKLDQTLSNL